MEGYFPRFLTVLARLLTPAVRLTVRKTHLKLSMVPEKRGERSFFDTAEPPSLPDLIESRFLYHQVQFHQVSWIKKDHLAPRQGDLVTKIRPKSDINEHLLMV